MKRSSSEVSPTPSTDSDIDVKPALTSPSEKSKETPSSTPKGKSSKKVKKEGESQVANGEWTEDKRAVFMDMVIAAGYKALNLDEVAVTVSHVLVITFR
jgi:hypothetical protein